MSDASHSNRRPHPVHPRHLVGSKWSSAPEHEGLCYRHWEVVRYDSKRGEVVLRATLDRDQELRFAWRLLRERDRWLPGWRQGDPMDQ